MTIDTPHFHGHRGRLREKLIQSGPSALADYELLEVILFAASPRGDVKPMAKELLKTFKNFASIITADADDLRKIKGLGDAGIAAIKAVAAANVHMLKEQSSTNTVLNSWDTLIAYLSSSLSHEKIEHFRVLFLDRKNKLLADEMQQTGTIDHTPVYPREIAKQALKLEASAVILVHNHPSGDPTPSQEDMDMTDNIVRTLAPLRVSVHDHIIIGKGEHFSFKSHELI